jgi:hypothetical protein
MKIVRVDNFGREDVADGLVAEGIGSVTEGNVMLKALQATCHPEGHTWYELKTDDDDYVLSRGMEDLI